jgi:outer membrane protein assembly factor BamB
VNFLLPNYTWELRALDAASGSLMWSFTPDPAQFGKVAPQLTSAFAPVTTQDTLYVSVINLDYQAWIVALDVQTGAIKWLHQDLYFSDTSMTGISGMIFDAVNHPKFTVAGDKVFAVLRNDQTDTANRTNETIPLTLAALNAQTGDPLWSSPITLKFGEADAVVDILVTDGQNVYFTGEQTYVFDAQTGAAKPTEPEALVVVSDDAVYKQQDKTLTAIDRANGQQRWQITVGEKLGCGLFAVSQQNVYRFCSMVEDEASSTDDDDTEKPPSEWGTFLIALDVQTGAERWRKPIAENPYTVLTQLPTVFGDRVTVIGGALGNLRVMTLTADGNEVWAYRVFRSYEQTITDGSRIYVMDTRPRWRGWLAQINPAWR